MDNAQDRTDDRPEQDQPQATLKAGRWREEKMIRDAKTGKLYGPYLYERWRDHGICRSKYIGKVL